MAGEPTVTTEAPYYTIAEKAEGYGAITAFGDSAIIQHGHCWSTSENPTTGDDKTELGLAPNLGPFKSILTGLIPNTQYYIKAYARNTQGTGYGAQMGELTTGIIGKRFWWTERTEFHFFGEDGVEYKIEGIGTASDSDLLTHLIG